MAPTQAKQRRHLLPDDAVHADVECGLRPTGSWRRNVRERGFAEREVLIRLAGLPTAQHLVAHGFSMCRPRHVGAYRHRRRVVAIVEWCDQTERRAHTIVGHRVNRRGLADEWIVVGSTGYAAAEHQALTRPQTVHAPVKRYRVANYGLQRGL